MLRCLDNRKRGNRKLLDGTNVMETKTEDEIRKHLENVVKTFLDKDTGQSKYVMVDADKTCSK